MPVTAVIGAQWGDEGKGKIVDRLASRADMVVRFGGGSNAGHTIVNEHGRFRLHSLPSGVFYPGALNLLGTGTVVDFDSLNAEMGDLKAAGVATPRLAISNRAHVIMPYHKLMDRLKDASAGVDRLGTTGQGIGPTYADKADRVGFQAGEFLNLPALEARLSRVLHMKNQIVESVYGGESIALETTLDRIRAWAKQFGPYVVDPVPIVRRALSQDSTVILEGQLGVMRDLDWGAYPFVTSSTTFAAGGGAGAGIPPSKIRDILGVCKAYTTAVGEGPFPTELQGAPAERLREAGGEYGATTGRPRRVGWLDGVALRYAVEVSAMARLALTKLDVLDDWDEVKVAVAYRVDGESLEEFPGTAVLSRVEPVFNTMPGWRTSTARARRLEELPGSARAFVQCIEELAGVPVSMIGVGAERTAIVEASHPEPAAVA